MRTGPTNVKKIQPQKLHCIKESNLPEMIEVAVAKHTYP